MQCPVLDVGDMFPQRERQMRLQNAFLSASLLAACSVALATTVPAGTEVKLTFDQAVTSDHAKAGDKVAFHVSDDVMAGGKTVIKGGTKVWGVIESVDKRGRFGKNARIRLVLNPVRVHGKNITLEPRDKGKPFQGSKTDKAAIASGAGALVLGPIGLAGGYFIAGKKVNIKEGESLRTEVSKTVNVR